MSKRIFDPADRWIVGITGASGAIYGVRLIRFLLAQHKQVHVVISDAGWRVLQLELGWQATRRKESALANLLGEDGDLVYHAPSDIAASIASGSYRVAGMVIVPCSMGTLAAVASGQSDNLLERAADCMLKEGRPLILVPRETPLHAIHLENMLKLARLGVKLIPAMPAFYHAPQTIEEMIDFVVGKTVDAMGLDHDLFRRWGEQGNEEE